MLTRGSSCTPVYFCFHGVLQRFRRLKPNRREQRALLADTQNETAQVGGAGFFSTLRRYALKLSDLLKETLHT